MRAVLVDDDVKVYGEPGDQMISLATLKKGETFELGRVKKVKKQVWVEATLDSGQVVFLPGDTKIFVIKKVQLLKDGVESHAEPDAESPVLKTYTKNTVLTANGIEKDDGKGWVRVVDDNGVQGYIRGDARIKVYQEATRAGGKKLMLTGGLFTVFGVAMYFFSAAQAADSGNMTFLVVAVVAFGLMQAGQGFFVYRKAVKEEQNKQ
jgi:hypothetical protein